MAFYVSQDEPSSFYEMSFYSITDELKLQEVAPRLKKELENLHQSMKTPVQIGKIV